MRPGEEPEGTDGEEDDEAELVVLGQGHVREDRKAGNDDGIEGAVVPEDGVGRELAGGPQDRPEGDEVVAVLARQRAPLDRQVDPDPIDHGRRLAVASRQLDRPPAAHRIAQDDPAGDDRDHDRGEADPDEMGRPATPAELGAAEPDEEPGEAGQGQEVGQPAGAAHPPGVVDRPAEAHDHDGHEDQRQPALGRPEREARPPRRAGLHLFRFRFGQAAAPGQLARRTDGPRPTNLARLVRAGAPPDRAGLASGVAHEASAAPSATPGWTV